VQASSHRQVAGEQLLASQCDPAPTILICKQGARFGEQALEGSLDEMDVGDEGIWIGHRLGHDHGTGSDSQEQPAADEGAGKAVNLEDHATPPQQ